LICNKTPNTRDSKIRRWVSGIGFERRTEIKGIRKRVEEGKAKRSGASKSEGKMRKVFCFPRVVAYFRRSPSLCRDYAVRER